MKNIKKLLIILSILLISIFSLTACNVDTASSNSTGTAQGELLVHYIDVGQGDAELIQVNGKNLLIDAGPNANNKNLVEYLKAHNVKKLDYIIATHPHEDHIGAMDEVIREFEVGQFYAPKATASTKTYEYMIKALKEKNLKINAVKPGETFDLGGAKVEFLAPNSSTYEDLNDYSAVAKVTYGNNSFLFTGDAEALSEKEILNKGFDVSCDVLKAGHHGSSTSTSDAFLKAANPKIVVISCAKDNKYGHPHKETMTKLNKNNITVYRTDVDGSVVLSSDGNKISKLTPKTK